MSRWHCQPRRPNSSRTLSWAPALQHQWVCCSSSSLRRFPMAPLGSHRHRWLQQQVAPAPNGSTHLPVSAGVSQQQQTAPVTTGVSQKPMLQRSCTRNTHLDPVPPGPATTVRLNETHADVVWCGGGVQADHPLPLAATERMVAQECKSVHSKHQHRIYCVSTTATPVGTSSIEAYQETTAPEPRPLGLPECSPCGCIHPPLVGQQPPAIRRW